MQLKGIDGWVLFFASLGEVVFEYGFFFSRKVAKTVKEKRIEYT
ncbi:MAG: hypothetical protein NTY46_14875 [Candidatus Sumerlaeota bacterium]|nr:hypothetical protein [Candidatus Sumerlaeota bacterium]